MAKPQRRRQQHLRQEQGRKRSYGTSAPEAKYKPEFPFNLLQNAKAFYIIGAVIMIGGVVMAALIGGGGINSATPDPATATPTGTASGSPTPTATPDGRTFSQAEQVIDAEAKTYTATIQTGKGTIVVDLFADQAPRTVNNFVFLAQEKYFDGLPFHRVVDDFVIQAGDPTGVQGDGRDGPGYVVEEDVNELLNEEGTLAMAKVSGATNFGSQWFINLKKNTGLDGGSAGRFYPFGKVTEGMDVAKSIVQGDTIDSITITEADR